MTAATINLTKSQTLTALGGFLQATLPTGIAIVVGQDNRVPAPSTTDYIVMTPILRERLETNVTTYFDGQLVLPNQAGARYDLMPAKVTVQIDVHGPSAADNVHVLQTLFRSEYAVALFKTFRFDVTPLYTSDPRQVPFLNESRQIEERYSIDAVLQCNPVVTTGQDFADTVGLGIISVDVVYPPNRRALKILDSQIVYTANDQPAKLRGWNWGIWNTVQSQDASDTVSQRATIVRIPLRWWGLYNDLTFESRDVTQPLTAYLNYAHLRYLDYMMAEAAKNKVYIDLFVDSQCGASGIQPGGFGGPESLYCDPAQIYPNGNNFWSNLQMRHQYVELWKFLVKRYASNPYFVFAEVMVEPNPAGISDKDINQFYRGMFEELRAACPGLLFITGGQSYKAFKIGSSYIPGSTDIVYTADMFMFTGGDQESNIANFAARVSGLQQFIAATGQPVLVQQTGVTHGDDPDFSYTNSMLSQLNAAGLPWIWWTYRDNNPNGFGPYYSDGSGGWIENTAVLNTIVPYFEDTHTLIVDGGAPDSIYTVPGYDGGAPGTTYLLPSLVGGTP